VHPLKSTGVVDPPDDRPGDDDVADGRDTLIEGAVVVEAAASVGADIVGITVLVIGGRGLMAAGELESAEDDPPAADALDCACPEAPTEATAGAAVPPASPTAEPEPDSDSAGEDPTGVTDALVRAGTVTTTPPLVAAPDAANADSAEDTEDAEEPGTESDAPDDPQPVTPTPPTSARASTPLRAADTQRRKPTITAAAWPARP
jgi:hypothetical protein